MKRFLKVSALIMTAVVATSLMACSNKNNNSAGGNKKITLKLWHIWTSDSDSNKQNLEAAVKDWNSKHPNVQVSAEGTENEAYKTKLKTAISANEAPDIFTSWGAGFSQPFVDAGKILPMDSYLSDETKSKLVPGALTYFTYNNKIYGLPYTTAVGTFFVNKEMFQKNNIQIPQTFDQLLTAVKAFKAKGITPIAVGEKDKWPGMFYYDALALREGGAKLNNEALAKKASFKDPAFKNAADKLLQLVNAGAFDKGALGLTRDESEVPFIQGQIPMYYNGDWVAGSVEKAGSPVKGKVIAMNFPALTDGKGDKDEVLGGAIDCFMVNNGTKYKDDASKAALFITQDISKRLYETGAGVPTWKFKTDTSKISPLVKQISDIANNSKGFVVWWDTYLAGADADVHKNLVSEIFGKQITSEQFVDQMQKLNEK